MTHEAYPEQSYPRLRKLLPKSLQPFVRGLRKRLKRSAAGLDEPYRSVAAYTQQHPVKQRNIVRLAKEIEANGIAGAIVECGVLDGGSAALMAWATAGSGRDVHLFDSWDGLPDPTVEDGEGSDIWAGQCVGNTSRVSAIMRKLGVKRERLNFHKGWFKDTFPHENIDKVALLHVDCDFYEPVLLTLNHFYPKMAKGGFIQLDDYNAFQGCDIAVKEFMALHPDVRLECTDSDGGARAWFISC
jgi:O-methyltransferase